MGKLSISDLTIAALGAGFALIFAATVMPPLLESGDVIGAFAAGFVNPYAAGYSFDTIFCGLILIAWAATERPPYFWVVPILCFIPGVATAFAVYLFLRRRKPSA